MDDTTQPIGLPSPPPHRPGDPPPASLASRLLAIHEGLATVLGDALGAGDGTGIASVP